MAKDFSRTQRVADFLQRELAVLIQREVRDPRIGLVSVTGVELSRDIAHAKVYVTFMEVESEQAPQQRAERVAILNKAAGFLRSELARVSTMRSMPRLQFFYDQSIERGSRMSRLIDEAIADDQARNGDLQEQE